MLFGVVSRVGQMMIFFLVGWVDPKARGFFWRGGIGQCNVTYRKHVALCCGCSIPAAEWWGSSAVGIVQLVAHVVDESILCVRGGYAALHKLLWWH